MSIISFFLYQGDASHNLRGWSPLSSFLTAVCPLVLADVDTEM